jgi:aspartate/methionine/tyrosine aminotransferase
MTVDKFQTASRTHHFTESVIREMTRVAEQYGAMNLAQGFPDFAAPDVVKEAAVNAIRADFNQYPITWGTASLRTAVAQAYRRRYAMSVDPEEQVVVCCGATECMIATLLATTNPGDEVIIFEPFYENYGPDSWISGATPRFVALRPPASLRTGSGGGRWHFDPDELRAAFTPATRAIIINSPHNPTGHVFSRAELQRIAELCIERDVLAITDEIYEFITYDGHAHVPMATLPGMAERTVTISGLSKTFSITGWRLGYAVAPAPIANAIRKVHDFLTVGAPTPLQEAGAVALGLGEEYYAQLAAAYAHRRELMLDALHGAGFKPTVPEGAYYIIADYSELSDEDDTAFAMRLVREAGVATVPGSSFYWDKTLGRATIRFAYSKKDETLRTAAERLRQWSRSRGVS